MYLESSQLCLDLEMRSGRPLFWPIDGACEKQTCLLLRSTLCKPDARRTTSETNPQPPMVLNSALEEIDNRGVLMLAKVSNK